MKHILSGTWSGLPVYLLSALTTLLLLTLASCTESDEIEEASMPADSLVADASLESGRINYMTFCLNCHGEQGRGDGPLNELIRMDPGDLTTLSSENGGTFPANRVEDVIRGTDESVEGHGDREMPVWSTVWAEQSDSDNAEEMIDARIAELIAYLVSIQG